MKSISVCKIDNLIFFRGYSETVGGILYKHGPYFMNNVEEGIVVLGNQCLRTFDECKVGIPHPDRFKSLSELKKEDPYATSEEAKLLDKIRKRKKDLRLSIDCENENTYHFTPFKVRNKNYASHIPDKILISNGDPENLGRTLLEAFDCCE